MDLMSIEPDQIAEKKVIGHSKTNRIFYMALKGGLHIVLKGSAEPKILGAGSHKALAKWLAERNDPDIEYDELEKSEASNPSTFQHLVPKYEALTNRLIELQKRK